MKPMNEYTMEELVEVIGRGSLEYQMLQMPSLMLWKALGDSEWHASIMIAEIIATPSEEAIREVWKWSTAVNGSTPEECISLLENIETGGS